MKKSIACTLGLLFCCGACRRADAPQAGARQRGRTAAVAVEVEAVRHGEIRDVRMFVGNLLPRARYVVAPKVPGRLVDMAVHIGDTLTPGQLIARIDDEEYVQHVAQARAALEVARATVDQQATALELAEREMRRVRALRDKQIASEAAWDMAEGEYRTQMARHKVALAQMEEKASALKAAEVRLSYTVIRAPDDIKPGHWYVDERQVDAGAMLAANMPLVTVVDLSALTAVINIIERDYPLLRTGMPVALETDAHPGATFPGSVARVSPALREASRQARVEINAPNEDRRLRPGMFVRTRIEFARREQAVLVSPMALSRHMGQEGVFRVDPEESRVRFIPVTVGIRAGGAVEILEPDLDGWVVTLGRHLLADGVMVVLPETPDAAADGRRADEPGDAS